MRAITHARLLALLFALFLFSVNVCADTEKEPTFDFKVDGICYKISSSTTVYVTREGYKGVKFNNYYHNYSGDIVIPSTVTYSGTTYTVTEIDGFAFSECKNLKSVSIPNTVHNIYDSAFRDSGLEKVDIPNSVYFIGRCAFQNCHLKEITFPRIIILGSRAFYKCPDLEKVVILGDIKSIGSECFMHCTKLKSVTLSENVKEIEKGAFYGCSSLETINFPEELETIGNSAFLNCKSLKSITIPRNVKGLYNYAFCGSKINELYMLADSAFLGQSSLLWCNVRKMYIGTMKKWYFDDCGNTNPLKELVVTDKVVYDDDLPYDEDIPWINRMRVPVGGIKPDTLYWGNQTNNGHVAYTSSVNKVLFLGPQTKSLIYNGGQRVVFLPIEDPSDVSLTVPKKNNDLCGPPDTAECENLTLYVPIGSKERYKKAEKWNILPNIFEVDFSQINSKSVWEGLHITTGITSPAIEENRTEEGKEVARYGLDGKKLSSPRKGINIVRMSDGQTKKVFVK